MSKSLIGKNMDWNSLDNRQKENRMIEAEKQLIFTNKEATKERLDRACWIAEELNRIYTRYIE